MVEVYGILLSDIIAPVIVAAIIGFGMWLNKVRACLTAQADHLERQAERGERMAKAIEQLARWEYRNSCNLHPDKADKITPIQDEIHITLRDSDGNI